MNKKIMICGGGTAGHIYPAISIIEQLTHEYNNLDIFYIGTKKGMESKLTARLGLNFFTIRSSGLLQKAGLLKKLKSYFNFIFNTISGVAASIKIIIKIKPDIILGMGGYVCGPVLLAGIFLGKKIYIHEQNYFPGRLNIIFARYAKKIFISFKETEFFLKKAGRKTVFTGNPVRKVIRECIYKEKNYLKYDLKPKIFTITAFGGSLGADKINKSFLGLWHYFKSDKRFQFILISGQRFFNELLNNAGQHESEHYSNLKIIPYENDMQDIYSISDLIIARAGANTIAELAVCNIPAILIPYPAAVNNHQYYNAKFLTDNKKAVLLNDSDTDKTSLKKILEKLTHDNFKLYNELKNKKDDNIFLDSHKLIAENIMRGISETSAKRFWKK